MQVRRRPSQIVSLLRRSRDCRTACDARGSIPAGLVKTLPTIGKRFLHHPRSRLASACHVLLAMGGAGGRGPREERGWNLRDLWLVKRRVLVRKVEKEQLISTRDNLTAFDSKGRGWSPARREWGYVRNQFKTIRGQTAHSGGRTYKFDRNQEHSQEWLCHKETMRERAGNWTGVRRCGRGGRRFDDGRWGVGAWRGRRRDERGSNWVPAQRLEFREGLIGRDDLLYAARRGNGVVGIGAMGGDARAERNLSR